MAKTNYNGSADAGASKEIVGEDNARLQFFFKNNSASAAMVLNFGSAATAANIFNVPAGGSVSFDKKSPYPIEKAINVFCASAHAYEAQVEN